MSILAIDPGPGQSAWAVWNGKLIASGKDQNTTLILGFPSGPNRLVVEQIKSYGMPVADSVFDTVFWTGRFCEAFERERSPLWSRMPRMTVKMHLCHDSKARDSNIRQALIDRFGGKQKAIGRKASPGQFYGVTGDIWQAIALAVTWWDLHGPQSAEAVRLHQEIEADYLEASS